MTELMVFLLILFIVKHAICDGFLQFPYQYLNKGNFRHPGGYVHAGIHGIGTFIALCIPPMLLLFPSGWIEYPSYFILAGKMALLDFCFHYVIDYSKTNLVKHYRWSEMQTDHLAIYSNKFFIAIVVDQCLHFATYLLIIWVMKL